MSGDSSTSPLGRRWAFGILGLWAGLGTLLFLVTVVGVRADSADAVAAALGRLATADPEPAAPMTTSSSAPSISSVLPPVSRSTVTTDSAPAGSELALTMQTTAGLPLDPSDRFGRFEARCPVGASVVYGARTEPRKYEYVVCIDVADRIRYHGIDVDTGADIRLQGCLEDHRFVFAADRSWRYEVADQRRTGTASTIELYRSGEVVEWRYAVGEEWGPAPTDLPPGAVCRPA